MGCRDMEKCEAAAREIRGKTLNKHVYARHIDLASIKSIKAFVEKIKDGKKHAANKTQSYGANIICIVLAFNLS